MERWARQCLVEATWARRQLALAPCKPQQTRSDFPRLCRLRTHRLAVNRDCRTAQRPNGATAERRDGRTARRPNYATAKERNCQRARLPNDATARERECRTAQLPRSATAEWRDGRKARRPNGASGATAQPCNNDVSIFTIVISRFRSRQNVACGMRLDATLARRWRMVSSASARDTRSD